MSNSTLDLGHRTASPFALPEALLDVSPARFADPAPPVEEIARRPLPATEPGRRLQFNELVNELAEQSRLDVYFGVLAVQHDAAARDADRRDAGPDGPVGCEGWKSEGERFRHAAEAHRIMQADCKRRAAAAAQDLRRLAGVT